MISRLTHQRIKDVFGVISIFPALYMAIWALLKRAFDYHTVQNIFVTIINENGEWLSVVFSFLNKSHILVNIIGFTIALPLIIGFCLAVYCIVHVIMSTTMNPLLKIAWIFGLISISPITMPIYYYLYIWITPFERRWR